MSVTACSYCDEPAISSTTIRVGIKPENPKHLNTQADNRKVTVVRVCESHRHLLPDPDRAS